MTEDDRLVGWLGRWASGRGPLYLLLAARLRGLIDDGLLAPGSSLPPDRVLARRLAVGRGTVVSAYELASAGRPPGAAAGQRHARGRGGAPDQPVVRRGHHPLLLHVLDPPDGVTLLTCAAPVGPPPELVEGLPGGGDPAAPRHRLPPGRAAGVPPRGGPPLHALGRADRARRDPGHQRRPAGDLAAGEPVRDPRRHGQGRVADLHGRVGDPARRRRENRRLRPRRAARMGHAVAPSAGRRVALPALAYTIPTAHNPTGRVMPPLARRRLVAWAAEADVPVIDDAVPADLCFDGEHPLPLAGYAPRRADPDGGLAEQAGVGRHAGRLDQGGGPGDLPPGPAARHPRPGRRRHRPARGGVAARPLRRGARVPDRGPETPPRPPGAPCCATTCRSGRPSPCQAARRLWVSLPRGDAGAFAQVTIRKGIAVPPGTAFDPAGTGYEARLRLPFVHPEPVLTEGVAGPHLRLARLQRHPPPPRAADPRRLEARRTEDCSRAADKPPKIRHDG